MFAWWCLSIAIAAVALLQLLRLNRQRLRLVDDPLQRFFFLRHVYGTAPGAAPPDWATRSLPATSPLAPSAPVPAMVPVTPLPDLPASVSVPSSLSETPPVPVTAPLPAAPAAAVAAGEESVSDEGIVYVDAAGRCTLADHGARTILHWSGGERTLSEVFAGGDQESAALLSLLAQQGSIDAYPTALAGPGAAPIEVRAVALRDRYDHLWGAVIFIHRAPAPGSRSAPSRR